MATAGGWIADRFGLPLAWLIGAAVTTAAISLIRAPVPVPLTLYRAGQTVVGVAVGLTVTADIVQRIGAHVWVIPAAAFVSLSIGRMLMPVVARYGNLDRTTAFFALVPAGIAEMADQAGRHGADVGAVATFHTLRVFLIVMILPPLITALEPPVELAVAAAGPGGWAVLTEGWTPSLGVALAIGLVAALAGGRIGVPSAFIIAPMAVTAVLSGSGAIHAEEPVVLLTAAQIALGLSLGARFQRATLARLPRALLVGIPAMLFHAGIMTALALFTARAVGFDTAVLLLGFATGGIAEMVLTAQTVGADAALVTAYQLARGLTGNLFAGAVYAKTVRSSGRGSGRD